MRILKDLEFDKVCGRTAAAMLFCAAVLIVCGTVRDMGGTAEIFASAAGDIAACAVISMYECTFAYAAANAVSRNVGDYAEFVWKSGRVFIVSGAVSRTVKLFFLMLPCSGGSEFVGGAVLIIDASVSWIIPMKILENRRAAFLVEKAQTSGSAC